MTGNTPFAAPSNGHALRPLNNPTAADKASWAIQRGETKENLFPLVKKALGFQGIESNFFFAPTLRADSPGAAR